MTAWLPLIGILISLIQQIISDIVNNGGTPPTAAQRQAYQTAIKPFMDKLTADEAKLDADEAALEADIAAKQGKTNQ